MPIYDLQIWFLLEMACRVVRISFSPDCKKERNIIGKKISQKRALIIVEDLYFIWIYPIYENSYLENIRINPLTTLRTKCRNFKNPQNSTQLLLKVGSSQFFFWLPFLALLELPNFNTCLIPTFLWFLYISVVFTPNKNSVFS